MKQVTLTIKLKLVNLNLCKAQMLEVMQAENTRTANYLLSVPINERRKLTTAKVQTDLCSAICNQTIRQTKGKAGQKTKYYQILPVEINNQNWKVFKNGETYSISFPTLKGIKRIPISVASNHWQKTLDKVLNNECQNGSIKLIKKRNLWYVYMTVTLEVPEVQSRNRIGCDRGQNVRVVGDTKRDNISKNSPHHKIVVNRERHKPETERTCLS